MQAAVNILNNCINLLNCVGLNNHHYKKVSLNISVSKFAICKYEVRKFIVFPVGLPVLYKHASQKLTDNNFWKMNCNNKDRVKIF